MRYLTIEQMAILACYDGMSKEEIIREIEIGSQYVEEGLQEEVLYLKNVLENMSDSEYAGLKKNLG